MIPEGNAMIAIPKTADIIVITFPSFETAYISPYPTEVRLIVAQYIASKKDSNVSGSTLNITKATMNTYPIAKKHTVMSKSFWFRNTVIIISIFFE